MLDKEMGYEISTYQMQYDANNKETDQKDPSFIYSGVQNGAAKFVTGNYNFETGRMTGILEHLKWESPKKRRRDSRHILLYKGLKGKASIPTDDLILLVRRCRNNHSMAYQVGRQAGRQVDR